MVSSYRRTRDIVHGVAARILVFLYIVDGDYPSSYMIFCYLSAVFIFCCRAGTSFCRRTDLLLSTSSYILAFVHRHRRYSAFLPAVACRAIKPGDLVLFVHRATCGRYREV